MRLELRDAARDVYDALDPDDRDELWWATVDGIDAWPEHDGHRVCWDLERLVPAFAARLHAELRRTWRPDPRYQISPIQPQRTWDPCWQVHHNGHLIATAYTRHEARVATWRHQRTGRT
ncbi:hypothetical protein GCM10009827_118890 [Dactylosporangium maewongense]|uniref:Uncharacterized protein n=1 Tax=Dactylosporangium maewongense TaxID=634393 RepID=A0ABN2DJR5_9ACTN